MPWICDEPGKWQDVGTDPKDWRAYTGACSLLAGGFTFHFESGKFGDRPTELERSLAAAALAALNAFPDDAPKGPYGRPAGRQQPAHLHRRPMDGPRATDIAGATAAGGRPRRARHPLAVEVRPRMRQWGSRNQPWLALGMVLASIAAQGSSVHAWSEILAPGFIFGALGSVGAVLTAIFADKPSASRDRVRPDRFIDKAQP